jgi:LysR family transcriptional activator of nhaA
MGASIRKNLTMPQRALNYRHLRYFAEVARRGSVVLAARGLFVAPQTVSAQVQELERALGHPLFERVARRMVLTAAGHAALEYATSIFGMGEEMQRVIAGAARARVLGLRLGVTDSVPKLLTVAILEPVIARHRHELELVCHEGATGELLGRLTAGEFDAVLADTPVPANLTRSLQARVLRESGISLLAAPPMATRLAAGFPASLDGAPFLAGSSPSSLLGQAIEAWFARHEVRPHVVGRIDDSALLKGLAQAGLGVAAVPTSIEKAVARQNQLAVVGRIRDIRLCVFLIRAKTRRPHPLVSEIEHARPTPR